jgi:DNA-binding XRE family transcriptional regulator
MRVDWPTALVSLTLPSLPLAFKVARLFRSRIEDVFDPD